MKVAPDMSNNSTYAICMTESLAYIFEALEQVQIG